VSSETKDKRPPWPWVWLFSMLPFLGWWLTGLLDLDEGFYGAVAAEMNRRGEWITPYYNGHPWFEKPILTYWVTKPFLWVFGDQVGPRLPSVLATAATFAVIIWFAKRRMTEWTAAKAVLILATSILFVALGRMLMTDPLLNLAITAGFLTFWESLVGDYRWRWVTAACLGLGVLAKGPVAILLFVPLAVWTFWREPELRPSFRKGWIIGTLILAGVIATWYVPAYLANREQFVQQFLIEQNLKRFTGGDAAHTLGGFASLIFFIPILLLGMAPWSFLLWNAWPRSQSPEVDAELQTPNSKLQTALPRYLAAWAAIVFLFFSLSGAKLPHYILPCFVPIALLVGDHLQGRNLKPYFIGAAVMAILANAGFILWYRLSGQQEAHALTRELEVMAAPDDAIILYQLPRRQKSLGTGKPKIQETSLPSLLLYLNRTADDAENLNAGVRSRHRFWVFTRASRSLPQPLGWIVTRVPTKTEQRDYALYRLEPSSSSNSLQQKNASR